MEKYLQTGCLAAGILCFIYFAVILTYAGLRTSLCWLWVLGGLFFLALRRVLYLSAGPGSRLRPAAYAMLLLLAAGLIVIAAFGSRVVAGMHGQIEQDLDYVIVLGAQVRGDVPSRALQKRIDGAVRYAQENPETVFILSGGQGPDEGISEAECIRRGMEQQGVEPGRLLLEDRSTSTEENMRFSAAFLDRDRDRVGVLTNSFHVCRALALARAQGYRQAFGLPAASDPLMQPHNILREICCLLYSALRGSV